jgi:basic amino acid/polyamine antiporter, APA family
MAEQIQVKEDKPQLERRLGTWDAALLTIGSVLGTGIFITTGDIARVLPHPGLILFVWILGGVFTLAGALTYAELGGMFPRAGGQYQYLKEAYGIFWGFLFGWGAFWVIMTGGISALAVGFGQYFGAFIPFFSTDNVLLSLPLGFTTWNLNGGQVAGSLAIVLLTAINYLGLKEGAGVQNAVTVIKIGSIIGLALLGLFVEAKVRPQLFSAFPAGSFTVAIGVALIAVLWSYDGWYGATNVASEMRHPERNLPMGLIIGTIAITLLYTLMNLVYIRALSVEEMGQTGRIAESAASILFGPMGGRIITAAVLVSTFGCISATILYAARIYLPMAQDGVFFPALAKIHPKHKTPSTSIVAQGIWAFILTFSGTYEQLYTFVIFVVILFHLATGIAVFVLRRTRPDAPRPYRTWGYPVVPVIFILSSALLIGNTLLEKPVESLIGVFILALGVPAYYWWRRSSARKSPGQA